MVHLPQQNQCAGFVFSSASFALLDASVSSWGRNPQVGRGIWDFM